MQINVRSAIWVTREAAKHMRRVRQLPVLTQIASVSACGSTSTDGGTLNLSPCVAGRFSGVCQLVLGLQPLAATRHVSYAVVPAFCIASSVPCCISI